MDVNYLSRLPIDLFIAVITYLPFRDVMSLCNDDELKDRCTKYSRNWQFLIDNTFKDVYDYKGKLEKIWKNLRYNKPTYNYKVYTELVNYLDSVTQLMIYYRQKDMEAFNDRKFNNIYRFLAAFLLGDIKLMKRYFPDLPDSRYQLFIDMLEGKEMSQTELNTMLVTMARFGSPVGVSKMLNMGADLHANNELVLLGAVMNDKPETVNFLLDIGADIHSNNDEPLLRASSRGFTNVVELLLNRGADIHANNDAALEWATFYRRAETIDLLLKRGANPAAII